MSESSPTPSAGASSKITPLQMGLIGMLAASALINYVDRQATNVISPLLIHHFGLTAEQWGWVNSVFALTYIFTSSLGGLWVDRVGVRRGLLIGTVVWSIAAVGHSLSTGFWSLCFWRAMLAVGEGPGGAALLKGVRQVLPPRLQDSGTSLVGAGTLLGALLAPLVAGGLADRFGWRAAFVLTGSLGALWIPVWIGLSSRAGARLEAPKEPVARGQARLDLRSPALWATTLAIFFTIPPTVFTLSFLAHYLSQTFGLPVARLAALQWQPYLAMDLGQLAGGAVLLVLIRRGWRFLSARRLVMCLGFVGSTTMLMVASASSWQVAIGWLDVSRFCFQFAYVALLAYGITCVPEHQAGAMNGWMNATFGACSFVFNPLIGRLCDAAGGNYGHALVMVSLSPLAGLALWLVISAAAERRSAGREQEGFAGASGTR